MGDTSMMKIGPVGNEGIRVWDEKGHSEIGQIFISYSDQIHSFQFHYFENGSLVVSDRYGQLTGDNFHTVILNYPSEYLTGISGSWDDVGISSITFHTNLGTHGPIGQPVSYIPNDFCFEMGEDRQFGGFHGTASHILTSIGVYIKPITTLNANGGHVKVEAT